MTAQSKLHVNVGHTCETEGCDNAAYCMGLCQACYSYEWFWTRKKKPSERRKHAAKLEIRQHRLDRIAAHATPRRVK